MGPGGPGGPPGQPQQPGRGPGGQPLPPANRFLQPVHKCDMSLTDLLGRIERHKCPFQQNFVLAEKISALKRFSHKSSHRICLLCWNAPFSNVLLSHRVFLAKKKHPQRCENVDFTF
jgi:hypothetical protein